MRARLVVGLAAALVVAVPGCGPASVGDGAPTPTPTPTATPTPEPGTHLTTDTTWTGTVTNTGTIVVDPGVTLTVSTAATIQMSAGAGISVHGHLEVAGFVLDTSNAPAVFEATAGQWNGITIRAGGSATIRNVELRSSAVGIRTDTGAGATKVISAKMTNVGSPLAFAGGGKACRVRIDDTDGAISISGGTALIRDSDLRGGGGDRILFSGNGSLELDHIVVGGTSEHCLIHGGQSTLVVTKSVFENGEYAFMIAGTTSSQVHFNRIVLGTGSGNLPIGMSEHTGGTVSATENWWGGPAFPGGEQAAANLGWDVTNPVPNASDARVLDAGPRAWGAGCEADASF